MSLANGEVTTPVFLFLKMTKGGKKQEKLIDVTNGKSGRKIPHRGKKGGGMSHAI